MPGLSVPIPSAADFAAAMSPDTVAFNSCARTYSMHLERLIRDRTLRLTMGRQAQLSASRRTWWDAMDAVVRGYEKVIEQRRMQNQESHRPNLSDEELEKMRDSQCRHPPLTGFWIRIAIVTYLVSFALLMLWRLG